MFLFPRWGGICKLAKCLIPKIFYTCLFTGWGRGGVRGYPRTRLWSCLAGTPVLSRRYPLVLRQNRRYPLPRTDYAEDSTPLAVTHEDFLVYVYCRCMNLTKYDTRYRNQFFSYLFQVIKSTRVKFAETQKVSTLMELMYECVVNNIMPTSKNDK